jgi:D-alanyl-D-alanine carboxypeptidase (penicillin-binding protein 5/6)
MVSRALLKQCKQVVGQWLVGGLFTLLATFTAAGGAEPPPPPPLPLTADAVVLLNPQNGQLLFAKQPHEHLPPASTTKILTALVALEKLNLNAKIPVSARAANVAPSRIGLQAGDTLYAQDLLYGLLLKSGNDAAETLAEAVGGSIEGFAQLMNARAWELGARDSHFTNPHGLPDHQHYSSAYDLALIFRQAMNNPLFAEIVRTHNADLRIETQNDSAGEWRMVQVHNSNRLLTAYEGTLGGKTGFTRAAKNCFVGEVSRSGVSLIVAVLGSAGKVAVWRDVKMLLDYGFAQYGLAPPVQVVNAAPAGKVSAPAALQGDE